MADKRQQAAAKSSAAAAAAAANETGRKAEEPIGPLQSVVAGLGTTVVSTIVSHPFEVVRSRQQAKQLRHQPSYLLIRPPAADKHRTPSVLQVCASDLRELAAITREEGVLGVYQGAGTHFVGHLLSGVVFFSVQAAVQRALYKRGFAADHGNPGLLRRVARKTFASSVAGIVQVVATQPIWLVKNRQLLRHRQSLAAKRQQQKWQNSLLGRICRALRPAPQPPLPLPAGKGVLARLVNAAGAACRRWWQTQSVTHDIVEIARKEGVRGMYAGLVPCMLMAVHQSIQYAAYDELKNVISRLKRGRPLSTADRVGASVLSRALALVVSNPMTVLRTRLMQKDSPYRNLGHAMLATAREDGLSAFFRGTSAGLWKVVTAGIAMPCYDFVAEHTKKFFA